MGGITRRTAVKSGLAVTTGLVFGRTVVGRVRANGYETAKAFPVDLFVRAADDSEPSPKPDPQDLLVNRVGSNPVDDGTSLGLDGRQLNWGSFSAVGGKAKLTCVNGGTDVHVKMTGLVPGGLYTVWVVVFDENGFVETRDIGAALANVVGIGSLGANDGSENVVRARGSTATLDVFHPDGALSVAGSIDDCLLNEAEVHLVGVLHLDDTTYGPIPEPDGAGTLAEQIGFKFGTIV